MNTQANTHNQKRTRCLQRGWYPLGHVTLMAGDPGVGKSFLTHDLAGACSDRGMDALIITAEDGINDTIIPRMQLMRRSFDRLTAIDTPVRLDQQLDDIERLVEARENMKLIVLDPITAFLGDYHENSDKDIRTLMTRLGMLAEKHELAIVCVTHLAKADAWQQRRAIRVLGASAFTSCPPVVITVHQEGERRRVHMQKNTVCPTQPDEIFTISSERGVVYEFDEELSSRGAQPVAIVTRPGKKAEDALHFLQRLVRDTPVPTKQILELGRTRGLSKNTLVRAKETMNMTSIKKGKSWYWTR